MIDPESMSDLQSYLYAGRQVIHAEWVAAYAADDLERAVALADLWAHIHQAYALIKPFNQDKD